MEALAKRKDISERQKKAFKEIVKGSSIKDAMLKAGYSPASAQRSNVLKRTKTWKELMDKYLPDDLLQKVHLEGLKATQFVPRGIGKGHTELVEVPDASTRHKYLKTAYEIKGKVKQPEFNGLGQGNTMIVITAPSEAQAVEQPLQVEHVEVK